MGKLNIGVDQAVCLVTNDRIVKLKLESTTRCAVYPPNLKSSFYGAWNIDPLQQSKDIKTGEYVQFISIQDKKPLKVFPNHDRTIGELTTTSAKQEFNRVLTIIQERKAKNSMLLWLGIISLALAIVIGLIFWLRLKQPTAAVAAFAMPIIQSVTTEIKKRKNGHRKGVITNTDDLKNFVEAKRKKIKDKLCLIVDETIPGHYDRRVDVELIPKDSKERQYEGGPGHLLSFDGENFTAIEPENIDPTDNLPQDCYQSLDWEILNKFFTMSSCLGEKIKLGIFIGLIVGLLIVIFLVGTAAMGQTM